MDPWDQDFLNFFTSWDTQTTVTHSKGWTSKFKVPARQVSS